MKSYIECYTDGGYYKDLNLITWGYIVVQDNKVISKKNGVKSAAGTADVETAESEAMFQVIKDVISNKVDNYIMYSDSRSFIDKIEGKCANATGNPQVRYIQESISQFKGSPLPVSFQVKWKARRSDFWMKAIDDLVSRKQIGEHNE